MILVDVPKLLQELPVLVMVVPNFDGLLVHLYSMEGVPVQ